MPLFRAVVGVALAEPVETDSGERLWRYFRTYYVRAEGVEEAGLLVARDVTAEGGRITETDPVVRVAGLPAELRGSALDAGRRGVVWRSGRAFHPAE